MAHECLPQTLTAENLSQWIINNASDSGPNVTMRILSQEKVHQLEHTVSVCSQKIAELDETVKEFNNLIKNGTYEIDEDEDLEFETEEKQGDTIDIPPTVGQTRLKAIKDAAVKILREGHEKVSTVLYSIPWPEKKKMVSVDIEGNEFEERTRDMREDETRRWGTLFSDDNKNDFTIVDNDKADEPQVAEDASSPDGPTEDAPSIEEENIPVGPEKVEVEEKPKGRQKKSFI